MKVGEDIKFFVVQSRSLESVLDNMAKSITHVRSDAQVPLSLSEAEDGNPELSTTRLTRGVQRTSQFKSRSFSEVSLESPRKEQHTRTEKLPLLAIHGPGQIRDLRRT